MLNSLTSTDKMLEAEAKVNLFLFRKKKGGGRKQDLRGWGPGALSVEGEQREKKLSFEQPENLSSCLQKTLKEFQIG